MDLPNPFLTRQSSYRRRRSFTLAMRTAEEIGEISVVREHEVEWRIKDFLSYTERGVRCPSPPFNISGIKWFLVIYPNGNQPECSEEISLFLHSDAIENVSTPPTGATCQFGVKKADGTAEKVREIGWVFEEDGVGLGCIILNRTELQRLKSELMQSDSLTLICSLWVHETMESSKNLHTLSQNFVDMLISKRNCDVTLKVKQEEFSAHRFVLEARSPVFRGLLEAEKKKNTRVVDIPDCDPQAFKVFLTYLYSGKVEKLSCNVLDLFHIAHKYDVNGLQSACHISIMGGLSLENVLDAVSLGDRYDAGGVIMKAQKFFNENFRSIVTTAKWASLLETNSQLANKLLKNMAGEMQSKE